MHLYVVVSIHFYQTTPALFRFQTEKAPHAKREGSVLTIYGIVAPTFYMPHREWIFKYDRGKVAQLIPLSPRYTHSRDTCLLCNLWICQELSSASDISICLEGSLVIKFQKFQEQDSNSGLKMHGSESVIRGISSSVQHSIIFPKLLPSLMENT